MPNSGHKFKNVFAYLRYGLLILRYTGPGFILQKLSHQLYDRTVFIGIVGTLDPSNIHPRANCVVTPATQDDVTDFFQQTSRENKEGRYAMLVRKWFYEKGFRNCFIARTIDTNEPCNIRWVLTSKDIKSMGFEDYYPHLRDDEVMFENVYTLEKFRRKGFQECSLRQLCEILWEQGYRRHVGHIAEDNLINLNSSRKRGNLVFEKVLEKHFLFFTKRETLERYNPPVLIKIERKESKKFKKNNKVPSPSSSYYCLDRIFCRFFSRG